MRITKILSVTYGINDAEFNINWMKLKYLILLIFSFSSALLFSQRDGSKFSTKYNYIGLGWVGADDNADFSPDFSTSDINQVGYPSMVSFGKILDNNLRFDLSAFYTKLNRGVYGEGYDSPGFMLSCDLNAGYLVSIIGNTRKDFSDRKKSNRISLDIYPLVGAGYTYRTLNNPDLINSATANVGGGINVWAHKNRIGVNLQALGKFGVKSEFPRSGANYIQYSVSLLYRIKNTRRFISNLNDRMEKF